VWKRSQESVKGGLRARFAVCGPGACGRSENFRYNL